MPGLVGAWYVAWTLGGGLIDVIVPVYAGEEETRRCLAALHAARCQTAFELIVVDDCSPEPALSAWLAAQAAAGQFTLLRHARNRGFVAAVNTGMALHPGRDVVLLNSDTEVANDWLDRIAACAASLPRAATITPFSNNATVCSYPYEGWDGELPGQLGLARLDRLFADTLARRVVDLPTAVGFCMFIRRACLDALGAFDEAAFGHGYGEENDFSLRAAKAGWRNVLAADVFVYHRGAVSFGAGRFERMRQAERTLLRRHPDYNQRVNAFIARDPLAPLRAAIDRARVDYGIEEARQVLGERYRERAMLKAALRAARARAAAVHTAPPKGLRQCWREWLDQGVARLEGSRRWGPRRRSLMQKLLRRASTLASGKGQ
jgi:GT2 family glycosyltransferase